VSCPHAHQQNGATERKHRHIVEVGLSLLAQSSVPLKYWDQAFLSAVYLINRTPSRVIEYQTPLERLFEMEADYTSLRVFGCACWLNLRPYNAHKLSFRSKQCAFLGYSNLHKGFKCLDIATGRIYISRDVVFDEDVFPFSKLNSNAGARFHSEHHLLDSNSSNSSTTSGDEDMRSDCANVLPCTATNPFVRLQANPTQFDEENGVSPGVTPSTEHEADPPSSPVRGPGGSASDQAPDAVATQLYGEITTAPMGSSAPGRAAASPTSPRAPPHGSAVAGTTTEFDPAGSSTPSAPEPVPASTTTPVTPQQLPRTRL
jgi:hypothetical protein